MADTSAYKTDQASVYLATESDLSNADIVTSLLHSYNILVERKFRGAGDYLRIYMGSTGYTRSFISHRSASQPSGSKTKMILRMTARGLWWRQMPLAWESTNQMSLLSSIIICLMTDEAFLDASGVGQAKLKKYGAAFMQVIYNQNS